jgi:2-hydroxyacyl-CoA lyase 1
MGVGFGFAIAAQLAHPTRRVVCIQGDSAFGFSAMELETICRYNLPIVGIIINNNGIYSGIEADHWKASVLSAPDGVPVLPSTALLPGARYEKIIEAFGGLGFHVSTPGNLWVNVAF